MHSRPAVSDTGQHARGSHVVDPTAGHGVWRRVGLAALVSVLSLSIAYAQAETAAPPSHPADAPNGSRPMAGWSAFEIKKTPAELADTMRLAETTPPAFRTLPGDVRPPPQQDVLRLSTGLAYLQGADGAADLSGGGKINGMLIDFNLFLTAGAIGLQSRSGRISIFSPDMTWRAEAGDLYSDLGGVARGARVSWRAGPRWTPSVSLYVPRPEHLSNRKTVVAYRDRFQLLPRVRLGSEVTTDGSMFLQGEYGDRRLNLSAFSRYTRALFAGRDQGIAAGFAAGRGIVLSTAIRFSNAAHDSSSRWQLASIRLPLPKQASVTLERSWWSGSSDDGAINAVTVQLPLGPVRLSQRLQWGRTDFRHRAVPFGFDRRQSAGSASYTPGAWGNITYQQFTQWFDDGRVQQFDEVASMFQIGRRTSVQLTTAFPDLLEPQRLRARVSWQLSSTLQLELQYGRLSAFQMAVASGSERSRVMITLRKSWQVRSPSRGGEVRGRTVDQAGHPVPGALVSLGPYSTITDAAGAYRFSRVPGGEFELGLDRSKLPVSYAWDESPRSLTVAGSSRAIVDLEVTPLNTIRGRVYVDRNHNGRFDNGEAVAKAVVTMDGRVTATGPTGAYAFYNQPPGRYTIRLDVPRLANGLFPTSPAALQVELTGDRPLAGADFVVEERDMPILMRKLPR